MNKLLAALFALLVIGAIALVVMAARRDPAAAPGASAATSSSAVPASAPSEVAANLDRDAGVPPTADDSATSSAFDLLPDGGKVPGLPEGAPQTVRLGIVLFQYDGAEGAAKDAPTRDSAEAQARATMELAKQDFAEAVKRGDPGSTADAGRVPRGVLEPAIEYVVFTLEKDALHDVPIDTPRGYWIVKRIQ